MEGIAIILLSLCYPSILISVYAADTITGNQTIRDGETIVSARGEFEMGLFSPRGRPNDQYFGIWYKKISTGTVVWVANRASPIAKFSGVIRVSSRGITLSTNYHNSTDMIIIWSSNYSRSVNSPKAQLLDTGNLVFMDENGGGDIVWQSFDYPTDNILPGMKFGVDLVTGMNRYFVSWKSEQDPSPGNYVYMLDLNGYPQMILWEESVITFRVGPWLGPRSSGYPILNSNGIFTSKFVIAKNEIYYISNLVNASDSVITRSVVTPAGDIRRLIWNKQKKDWTVFLTLQTGDCDIYGYCGTYGVCNANKYPRCECMKGFHPKVEKEWAAADWSDGCVRNVPLSCGNGDGFLKYSGVKIPDTRWAWYNMTMDITECEGNCLKNCNCTAYSRTDFTDGGKGCLLWFGGLIDIRGYSEDGQDLYVKMAASEITRYRDTRRKKRLWTLITPVVVITVILGLFLFYAFKKRWLNRKELVQHHRMQDLELPLFDFIQIAKATNNFSSSNKLGEGGFGTVYKGTLTVGQEIAVKRLSTDSRQGLVEFMNEVLCIAKLQHRNLVKLIGCCIQEQERLLIYEYMPNGSLDSFIFDKQRSKSFDWPKRYNIINGIARGLLYLHQDSRLRIIHRDLKASNILLDNEMNPKISDFGLARIFGGSETQTSTTRVVGTYGYMPPEYALDGLFSVKSDVYSFGVLLLEIISGTRNRYFHCAEHNLNLIGHAWRKYNEGNLSEVVDNLILDSSSEEEIFRVIQIGLLCVQEYPEDRPNMSLALQMLTSTNVLPAPKQPGFFSERRKHRETGFSSPNAASSSSNDFSISFFAPRL